MQDALRMARTTQIYASRMGTREIYERVGTNEWMWAASLDDRVCLACVCMHGQIFPVTELLNDHHMGRCAMVPITPRWSELGYEGGGEWIDQQPYLDGVHWFTSQPMERQRRIMGVQLLEAWQRNEFILGPDAVVGTYDNDIFGPMRRRRTNAEILR